MRRLGQIIALGLIVLLASCANGPEVYSTGNVQLYEATDTEMAENDAGQQAAEMAAQQEAEQARVLEQERQAARARLQEQRRVEERELEAQRIAEQQAQETLNRQAEQARQQRALEQRRQREAQLAEERVQQQDKIAALTAEIEANKAETENLDAANETLRQAVASAEEFSSALSTEQQKYTNIDPVTGKPEDELSAAMLEELSEEIQRLRAQAASLQGTAQ